MIFFKRGHLVRVTLAVIFLMHVFQAVAGDPLRDGVVAYRAGEFSQALDAWLPLAEQGHVLAQTLVGSLYAYGQGVERDDAVAARWFQRAAEAGSAQAQYNLAILYENGWGVSKDLQQARHWYRTAADQGRTDAANRYALLTAPAGGHDTATTTGTAVTPAATTELMPHIPIEPPTTTTTQPGNDDQAGLVWMAAQPADNFTLQLAASVDAALLNNNIDELQLEVPHYAIVESRRGGVAWYALIYGSYTNLAQAKQAIDDLPDIVRSYQPWIRPFADIKAWRERTGTIRAPGNDNLPADPRQ